MTAKYSRLEIKVALERQLIINENIVKSMAGTLGDRERVNMHEGYRLAVEYALRLLREQK